METAELLLSSAKRKVLPVVIQPAVNSYSLLFETVIIFKL